MNRSIDWNDLLFDTAVFAAAIAAALLLHALLVRIAQAAARRTPDSADDKVVARMAPPLRWVLVAIAFAVAGRFLAPDAEGPTWVRQLVGLVIRGRGIARHGYRIFAGERETGHVTSGTQSPTLGLPIAMGFVAPGDAAVGTMVEIEIRDQPVSAEVVELPFYRRPTA